MQNTCTRPFHVGCGQRRDGIDGGRLVSHLETRRVFRDRRLSLGIGILLSVSDSGRIQNAVVKRMVIRAAREDPNNDTIQSCAQNE